MIGYVTVAQADLYVDSHYLDSDKEKISWKALDNLSKEILLCRSADSINLLPYSGRRTDITKEEAFPRYPSTSVPSSVIMAQIENAISDSMNSTHEDLDTYQAMYKYGISSYSIGNFSESFIEGTKENLVTYGIVSSKAQKLLQPFLSGGFRIE